MNKQLLRLAAALLLLIAAAPAPAQQAGALPDSLWRAFLPVRNDTAGVILLNRLSAAIKPSDPVAGIYYARQALALARRKAFRKGVAQSWNTLGNAYMTASETDAARGCFEQALRLNREAGNRRGAGQNLGNLGNLAYLRGDFPGALRYLFGALRLFEALGDRPGIAAQLSNIGSIYEQQKDYRAALEYDMRALKEARALGDADGQAILLGNLGNICDNTSRPGEALRYDSSAMALYASLGDKEGVARNLSNLSQVFLRLKDAPKAYDCLQRALALYRESGDDNGLGFTYLNLGDFFLQQSSNGPVSAAIPGVPADSAGCLLLAIDLLHKAVEKNSSTGNLVALASSCKVLSDALKAAGKHQEALAAFTRYKELNDSAFAGDSKTQIANLETQRALELKDKQIQIDRLAVAKKRNERGFFLTGIGLLLAVVLVVFRNYRIQRRLNGALAVEKEKVELRTAALDVSNKELSTALTDLKETQEQLIIAEKQKENEMIRSRISQDIHDDISSELTRISWVSELAKKKAAGAEYAAIPGLLDRLSDSSRETVTKLGEIIWTVNPGNDSLGALLAYMRGHITKFFADSAFQCRIDFPQAVPEVPVHPELKRNLYLVMKEALHNAAKYSGAANIAVTFRLEGDRYTLRVADDGRGMEAGVIQGGGNGLANMRRRMEAVRGSCWFASPPGGGTVVSCKGVLY